MDKVYAEAVGRLKLISVVGLNGFGLFWSSLNPDGNVVGPEELLNLGITVL
jgi:hypothetical protein